MHGRTRDNPQQEPGGAGFLEAEVAPGDHGGERGSRESEFHELELRLRAWVRAELGATQTSRQAKAEARRRVRKGGRRGCR